MLSVLMSVYSAESPHHLSDAMTSLQRQSVMPDEIILVQDGPLPEELSTMVHRWQGALSIRLLPISTNVGLARSLNHGLRAVTHPWVMRFDTDDLCVSTRVERQLSMISAEPSLGLIGGQIVEFDSDPLVGERVRRVPLAHDDIVKFSKRRNPFNHMTVCFRTDVALRVGGYPLIPFMEDYALWVAMLASGVRSANSPDVLVHARIGNGMLRRRAGLRYVRSEAQLQSHMVRLGVKSTVDAVVDGIARSSAFILPKEIRAHLYRTWLRS